MGTFKKLSVTKLIMQLCKHKTNLNNEMAEGVSFRSLTISNLINADTAISKNHEITKARVQNLLRDNFQEWFQYVDKMPLWTTLEKLHQSVNCILL